MRIALVSQEFPPDTARGGIGTQYEMKARGLAQRGHEVFVLSRSRGSERGETVIGGVSIIRFPGFENRLPEMTDPVQWLTQSTLVAAELERLHQQVRLDLVDFPEWGAEGYVWLLNRTPWKTVPAVLHLQGPAAMLAETIDYPPQGSTFLEVAKHMEGMCISLADRVFSSSRCSAQWAGDHYDVDPDDIPIIHLGVDIAFCVKPQPVSQQPTIAFVGRLAENKGVIELVEAAGRLVHEIAGLKLRLIGRGDEKTIRRLKESAGRHGEAFLDIAGFVPRDKLPDEYNRAHVFAAPSYYEGGPGFVYLEAMACGLPVIGCRGSGVDEVVRDGYNGFLVEPRSVDELTSALRRLLTDDDLRSAMGRNGLAFVKSEADPEDCLDRLESFYTSVVRDSVARTGAAL